MAGLIPSWEITFEWQYIVISFNGQPITVLFIDLCITSRLITLQLNSLSAFNWIHRLIGARLSVNRVLKAKQLNFPFTRSMRWKQFKRSNQKKPYFFENKQSWHRITQTFNGFSGLKLIAVRCIHTNYCHKMYVCLSASGWEREKMLPTKKQSKSIDFHG